MTRLDALKALVARPTRDGYDHVRSYAVVQPADVEKLRLAAVKIQTKRSKPRRKTATASRISWLRGVHHGKKGA